MFAIDKIKADKRSSLTADLVLSIRAVTVLFR